MNEVSKGPGHFQIFVCFVIAQTRRAALSLLLSYTVLQRQLIFVRLGAQRVGNLRPRGHRLYPVCTVFRLYSSISIAQEIRPLRHHVGGFFFQLETHGTVFTHHLPCVLRAAMDFP